MATLLNQLKKQRWYFVDTLLNMYLVSGVEAAVDISAAKPYQPSQGGQEGQHGHCPQLLTEVRIFFPPFSIGTFPQKV